MSIYSVENIEQIIMRLLRKEGMTSMVPEPFKSLHDELKLLNEAKMENIKHLRQLRKESRKLRDEASNESGLNDTLEEEFSKMIYDLDVRTSEDSQKIEECEKIWNEAIEKYAKELLNDIRTKKLKVKIDDFELFEKTTFKTGDFASKVVEQLIKEDIAKHYKKKPADRNIIIEQLKGLLGNKLPKIIIRADIKSFFESVPMDKVMVRLEDYCYVSTLTMHYLKEIHEYVISKGVNGVPRGLAFSSFLTEIYLQKTDDYIQNLTNLYFYQRYVDDIVMLFSVDKSVPPKLRPNDGWKHWKMVKEIFQQEDLPLHDEGEKRCIIYSGKTTKNEIDYLGYKFIMHDGKLTVMLSDHRIDRYKKKINAIFNHYNRTARDNQSLTIEDRKKGEKRRKRQQPLRRLFGHLSALTGNGKLKGPKSSIMTGVYYSNMHITSLDDLRGLDAILAHYVKEHFDMPENLFQYDDDCRAYETRLRIKDMIISRWSFVDGFENRRFCNNSSYFNRLKQIKKLCK